MGQKDGEKWTAAVDLQPTIPKPDRLLAVKQWQTLLGEPNVLPGKAAAAAYGADTSGAHRHIAAALRIEDGACLPDVMHIASQHQSDNPGVAAVEAPVAACRHGPSIDPQSPKACRKT